MSPPDPPGKPIAMATSTSAQTSQYVKETLEMAKRRVAGDTHNHTNIQIPGTFQKPRNVLRFGVRGTILLMRSPLAGFYPGLCPGANPPRRCPSEAFTLRQSPSRRTKDEVQGGFHSSAGRRSAGASRSVPVTSDRGRRDTRCGEASPRAWLSNEAP